MTYVRKFATDCKNFLNINRPVRLVIVRRDLFNPDWDAYCRTTRKRHFIMVSRHSSRGLLTTVAHELVHAAVDEQFQERKHHGKRFRSTASSLYIYLKARGYRVTKLYLKDVDVT